MPAQDSLFKDSVNPWKDVTLETVGDRVEFPCTQCGGDAYVGISAVHGPNGEIVKSNERLCPKCAKARGCPSFITSPNK